MQRKFYTGFLTLSMWGVDFHLVSTAILYYTFLSVVLELHARFRHHKCRTYNHKPALVRNEWVPVCCSGGVCYFWITVMYAYHINGRSPKRVTVL